MISQNSEDSQNYHNEMMCNLIRKKSHVISDRLEVIRQDLIAKYPEWSTPEINKLTKFVYLQVLKRM
jgi:hypothetical protein